MAGSTEPGWMEVAAPTVRWWTAAPQLPTLYLHGADDGCMAADFTPAVRAALPSGSGAADCRQRRALSAPGAADEVGRRVVEFLRT